MWNEAFGWFWIGVGILVGAWMGVGFRDEKWLGGYASWPRRMVRLGHIAMIALGMLNVLFAHSVARIALPPMWVHFGSWMMIAGAVGMPLLCGLCARWRGVVMWFALPVLCLGTGVTIAWVGLVRFAMGGRS